MKIAVPCTMSPMRSPLQLTALLALALSFAAVATSAHAAEKLKGFYSGSGGLSAEVHRVLIIEFAADGTAILQQKWQRQRSPDLARPLETGQEAHHRHLRRGKGQPHPRSPRLQLQTWHPDRNLMGLHHPRPPSAHPTSRPSAAKNLRSPALQPARHSTPPTQLKTASPGTLAASTHK